MGVVATVAVIAAVAHLVSKQAIDSHADSNTNGGVFASFRHRRLRLQPLKTVIVVWQIVTQVRVRGQTRESEDERRTLKLAAVTCAQVPTLAANTRK